MDTQTILVLNTGSSSLKFSLITTDDQKVVFSGLADKLGLPDATITFRHNGKKNETPLSPGNHKQAVSEIFSYIHAQGLTGSIAGVGHRVVHGGEQFKTSTVIDKAVLAAIEACVPFAPLHNPANLVGIRGAMEVAPHLPQVAVFDTAFHQTIPEHAYLYAVPMQWYRQYGVRRYGFHGTSHQYVVQRAAHELGIPLNDSAFISAHLGNGASATAVLNGKSVDTTMGFTPLEGLVMGTRSGDIDPGLPPYIAQSLGITPDEVVNLLNKKSGLLGLSELSNDMRELTEAAAKGHKGASVAIEVFVFRLAKAIGALAVSLPRIDALIFTGGIGENSALVREKVLKRLKVFGFIADAGANAKAVGGTGGVITILDSPVAMVVNTNEEAMIVKQTIEVLKNK
ncbi:MAG: acetate kinase [Chitinophagaceae bacterium]|nr:acetate kinase [Chitinophagaceae bacterium]